MLLDDVWRGSAKFRGRQDARPTIDGITRRFYSRRDFAILTCAT